MGGRKVVGGSREGQTTPGDRWAWAVTSASFFFVVSTSIAAGDGSPDGSDVDAVAPFVQPATAITFEWQRFVKGREPKFRPCVAMMERQFK